MGELVNISSCQVKKRVTPRISSQSIRIRQKDMEHLTIHIHTHTVLVCKHNLEKPFNLAVINCGRNLGYPERAQAFTWRTCKLDVVTPQNVVVNIKASQT